MSQIKGHPAHVDDGKIKSEMFFAKQAGPELALDVGELNFGVVYLEAADRKIARDAAIDLHGAPIAFRTQGKWARNDTRFDGVFLCNEGGAGAGIDDEPDRVPVEGCFHIEVVIRCKVKGDARESARGEKRRQRLTGGGIRAAWADVDHLPGAVDDRAKLNQFISAEQSIDVGQPAVIVEIARAGGRDWNIRERAIAHGERGDFAEAETVVRPAKNAADGGVGFLHGKAEGLHTVAIDNCKRSARVDHQSGAMSVDGSGDEHVIAEAPLQRSASIALGREQASDGICVLREERRSDGAENEENDEATDGEHYHIKRIRLSEWEGVCQSN